MVLHYPTVKPSLRKALAALMHVPELASFRLVGGTALSLQLGHRLSVDIDLFSDALYKTIDHDGIESAVSRNVGSLSSSMSGPLGVGKCFDLVFENDQVIKLDLFLSEPFVFELIEVDGIRMASTKEIAAMKLDVIQRTGRKKDFWDVHALLEKFTIHEMLEFHEKRYAYTHDRTQILENLKKPWRADLDLDPVCLRGYTWDLIKLDLTALLENER